MARLEGTHGDPTQYTSLYASSSIAEAHSHHKETCDKPVIFQNPAAKSTYAAIIVKRHPSGLWYQGARTRESPSSQLSMSPSGIYDYVWLIHIPWEPNEAAWMGVPMFAVAQNLGQSWRQAVDPAR